MNNKLKKLIDGGENQQVDFKKTINNPAKIAKTLVAFANTDGGALLIGVRDNGEVAGVKSEEEERYVIQQAVENFCKPALQLSFEDVYTDGKIVVIVMVHESVQKPHYALDEAGAWWAYIRNDDRTMLASQIVLNKLKLETSDRNNFVPLNAEQLQLLDYINKNERATVADFINITNLKKRAAERIIVKMLLANIIRVVYWQNKEYFIIADDQYN